MISSIKWWDGMDEIKQAFVEYFRGGEKERHQERFGLELEHFIVDDKLNNASYLGCIDGILAELAAHFSDCEIEDGHLFGLRSDDMALTLEPGAQLELSIMPKSRISDIEKLYRSFEAMIAPPLERRGLKLHRSGYAPRSRSDEIALLPKQRYRFMDSYFLNTGGSGRFMMRGTASCQLSVDYMSEKDFVEKFRLANALSPVLTFMMDNSDVFEGKPHKMPLLRTRIWGDVDPARCGTVPGLFEEPFGYEAYADYALSAPAIFTKRDGAYAYAGQSLVREALIEYFDEKSDVELYTSLLFPDVRLRTYIELRFSDSVDTAKMFFFVALIKGIFADISRFGPIKRYYCEKNIRAANEAIMKNGLCATVYGMPVSEFIRWLVGLANECLPSDERHYLEQGDWDA